MRPRQTRVLTTIRFLRLQAGGWEPFARALRFRKEEEGSDHPALASAQEEHRILTGLNPARKAWDRGITSSGGRTERPCAASAGTMPASKPWFNFGAAKKENRMGQNGGGNGGSTGGGGSGGGGGSKGSGGGGGKGAGGGGGGAGGGGNGGNWPSTTPNPSGGGRGNAPPSK